MQLADGWNDLPASSAAVRRRRKQSFLNVRSGSADEKAKQNNFVQKKVCLCGPIPDDPQTSTGPGARGWGPLLYSTGRIAVGQEMLTDVPSEQL